jgi:hypothetical protein
MWKFLIDLLILVKYYMFKLHVISDLYYGYNEATSNDDLLLPENTDLVIINGNIGTLKRSMRFAHEICGKYPEIPFVYNLGETERYWEVLLKYEYEIEDNISIRINNNITWPKNLYYRDTRNIDPIIVKLNSGQTISVFTCYGFPKINAVTGPWEDTYFFKNYMITTGNTDLINELNKGSNLPKEYLSYRGNCHFPIWFTKDYVNQKYEEMLVQARKWELGLKNYGIFVTQLNPFNDPRFYNLNTSPFLIHLDKLVWVTAKSEVANINFLGAKLYSNIGRGTIARTKSLIVDK